MREYHTIAESKDFIVLSSKPHDSRLSEEATGYQSEAALEETLIRDLVDLGYKYSPTIRDPRTLLDNARVQLQELNGITFTDREWQRFCTEYLDEPSDTLVSKARKVQDNYYHDFTFDDGRLVNIYLVNKNKVAENRVQVIRQFEQTGTQTNRYDVTLLVNGLPMVQIELKRRGVAIREAFNQVHRYSKESFNSDSSLYKYIQLFVISNGTDTRYFANTVKRDKNSFDFTMNWSLADNTLIKDLRDFTATFLQKETLLKVLLRYSVLDTSDTLLVMRPYQIAAAERLIWKVRSSHEAKMWSRPEGGGYVWHTTGSGKTLTSFKAARLATQLDFIDKVFFVVDRKDLDYQTMKEYQRFSPDSVNGSSNTAALKRNLEMKDNKIIVTTIQKLNNLMKSEKALPVYDKEVVFIFDECHRSQFGEAQRNLRKRFRKYYQFGFTGTPIFAENAHGSETTASVFGSELHSYVITDAIRDEKVLKFKVDYNDVRPRFKQWETETDEKTLTSDDCRRLLLHPDRIREVSQYILDNFRIKTHRTMGDREGFNAMFAVDSIDVAKLYYETLHELQQGSERPIKIALIYSYAPNEEQSAIGEIAEEAIDPSDSELTAMESSAKEFLTLVIEDYNRMFHTEYGVDSQRFQNYYRDLARRVKEREVDLLIVVGMFLTGFDAPALNTLFVDKNLRYHGLLQAFSRTNRIYNATKTFGNIITFRDLEQATKDSLALFGDRNTKDVILERSYTEYLEGFTDILTGEVRRGYKEIVSDLLTRFPDPAEIESPADKKNFVKLFGEYLRVENILTNFDEYTCLRELQSADRSDPEALKDFRDRHFLTEEEMDSLLAVQLLPERAAQDYRSTYNDIRDWLRDQRRGEAPEKTLVEWDDVVFEVDLLKSQEIDLDYILGLVLVRRTGTTDKEALIEEVRRILKSSIGLRAKEELVVDFIREANLDAIQSKAEIISEFYAYAQKRMRVEGEALVRDEGLKEDEAKRYLRLSLEHGYASDIGTDLDQILPQMSRLNTQYLPMKKRVYDRIARFVEKYRGVGGTL